MACHDLDVTITLVQPCKDSVQAIQCQKWSRNVHDCPKACRVGVPRIHFDPETTALNRPAVVIKQASIKRPSDLSNQPDTTLALVSVVFWYTWRLAT